MNIYRLLADVVVLVHFGFVLLVALGGFLVLWRWRFAWIHLPALVWGITIEFAGWICPLTPLEQSLREQAGTTPYSGGFIDHYVFAVLYPEGLTRTDQIWLGALLLVVNGVLYVFAWQRNKKA